MKIELEDLLPVVVCSDIKRKNKTLKKAEMLIDEFNIGEGKVSVEYECYDSHYFYRGRLRNGIFVRTIKNDFIVRLDLYDTRREEYHPKEKLSELVSRGIEKKRETMPGVGDGILVYWFSEDILPEEFNNDMLVKLFISRKYHAFIEDKTFRKVRYPSSEYLDIFSHIDFVNLKGDK